MQDTNKQRLLNAIHRQLDSLYEKWTNYHSFFCQDPASDMQGLEQCIPENPETWTPKLLREWDHISGAF